MKDLAALAVTAIMVGFALWNAFKIRSGVVKPALSTWLIILTGASLSLITYAIASEWDIKSGVLNAVDVVAVIIVIVATIKWSPAKTLFRPFEKWYLAGAAAIVIYWAYSSDPFVSNLLVQALIWIGYFPTIQKLWVEKQNTESFSAWGLVLIASTIALYPAIESGKILAIIYTCRTVAMVFLVLVLMAYSRAKTS